MMTQEEVLAKIKEEREYQDKKFPNNQHEIPTWVKLMEDKLEMVYYCWYHKRENFALHELLEVVSMGIACMEQYRAVGRNDDIIW